MSIKYEFTHFYISRYAAWFIYRRRVQGGYGPWTIYMGPFQEEDAAKERAKGLQEEPKNIVCEAH